LKNLQNIIFDEIKTKKLKIDLKKIKIAIIGASYSGKTSLLMRYIDKNFVETLPTIGQDLRRISFPIGG